MVIVSMESTEVSGLNEQVINNGNSSQLLVYAEFITSLSVANIYVGFDKSSTRFSISKITCNQQTVEVSVVDKAGSSCYQPISKDNDVRPTLSQYVAKLPKWVRVLPNTCSVIQPTPYGWCLRLNTNNTAGKQNVLLAPSQMEGHQSLPLKCRACENSLLNADVKVTTAIPVSTLGLSPNIEWHQMFISYFCHNHDSHHSDCGGDDVDDDENKGKDASAINDYLKQPTTSAFTPKLNEVFVGLTNFIFNSKVVDHTKIINNFEDGSFRCSRCHLFLGKMAKEVIECSKDAVHIGVNDKKKLLADFLSDCSKNCRRLCISLKQDSLEYNFLLLIWIMDPNLKVSQTHFLQETKQHSWDGDVIKVLYKQEPMDSAVAKQWLNDTNVNHIKVYETLLVELLSALINSTKNLPLAWRYANDFCIGYLEI